MKLISFLVLSLAALPTNAADPQPFAPQPFQLAPSPPADNAARDFHGDVLANLETMLPQRPLRVDYGIRLDLPVGPVRVDYSIPRYFPNVDAPGPGYRKLKGKRLSEGRNS